MLIKISATGHARAIYTEAIDLAVLGTLRIRRASHVEPDADGRWRVQIIDGPELGPYDKRSEAIAAEIAYLEERL